MLRVAKGLRRYSPVGSYLGGVCCTSSSVLETVTVVLELLELFQSQVWENLHGVFTQLSVLLMQTYMS